MKTTKMNLKSNLIQKLMHYETTKNIRWAKGEDAVIKVQ